MKNFGNKRRASLLLIFLFTVGTLAVVVSGVYWMVANEGIGQARLHDQAEKEMVDATVETVVRSAIEEQGKLQAANQTGTAWTYTAAGYQTQLQTLLTNILSPDPAVPTGQGIVSGLTVTVTAINFPSLSTILAKSNAATVSADNLASPFCRFPAYDRSVAVTVTGTLARTGAPYSWSKNVMLMREIPSSEIPYLVYGTPGALENLTTYADLKVSGAGSTWLVGGGPYALTFDAAMTSFVSTKDLCKYAATGTTAETNQFYSLDPEVIVVQFTGGVPTVIKPASGTPLPSQITATASPFDGKTRCQIDLAALPITSPYDKKKWYIYCPTADDKAAGILLKDNTGTQASATYSIATNGHVYLWNNSSVAARTAQLVATNYGAVAIASEAYDGTTTTVAGAATVAPQGLRSWAANSTLADKRFYDEFMGTTALSGRNAASYTGSTSTEGHLWTVHAASTATTADGTGSTGQLTISGGTANFSIPVETTVKSFGVIRLLCNIRTLPEGGSVEMILGSAAPYDVNNYISFKATRSSATDMTYAIKTVVAGVTGENTTGTWTGAGTQALGVMVNPVLIVDYCPATGSIIGSMGAGSTPFVVTARKLASRPSWIPSYAQTILDPNGGSALLEAWGILAAPGTMVATPHTGALTVNYTGSVVTSNGLSYAGNGTFALNISSSSAVRTTLRNYCERFLVNYPYCW